MQTHRRRLLIGMLSAGALPGAARAAAWPERPLRFIASGAAGGVIDVVARLAGQVVSKRLGQAVVVEARPGAIGNIGAAAVAKSAPDGYTVLITSNAPLAQNKYLYRKGLQFDPQKDFVPVSLMAEVPLVVVVRADAAARSLKDLVDEGRRKDGGLMFGTPGNGSLGHLTGVHLLQLATGMRATHVPYPGGPPAQLALLGGQLDYVIDTLGQYDEMIKAGKVRALAVTAPQRVPDRAIPTVAEAGFPQLLATVWIDAAVPRGTPEPVVRRLNEAINEALATPDVRQSLAGSSFRPVGGPPSELAARMSDEATAVWKDLIARYSISVE